MTSKIDDPDLVSGEPMPATEQKKSDIRNSGAAGKNLSTTSDPSIRTGDQHDLEAITLSIVVPVYNAARYLRRCIDSILNQKYSDYELILIDDGSKDESPLICDEYATLYPRSVRVIHQENSGVSVSRNRGIEESRGKYLMFVDSDDELTKEFSSVVYCLDEDTDIYCFSHDKIDENDELWENGGNDGRIKIYDSIYDLIRPEELCCPIDDVAFGVVWGKIYRKSAIGNIRFEEHLSLFEDAIWNREIQIKRVKTIRTVIYRYRLSKESLSHGHDPKAEDLVKVMDSFDRVYLPLFKPNARYHLTKLRWIHLAIMQYAKKKPKDKKRIQELLESFKEKYAKVDVACLSKTEKLKFSLMNKGHYRILKSMTGLFKTMKHSKLFHSMLDKMRKYNERKKKKAEYQKVERILSERFKPIEPIPEPGFTEEQKNIFVFWYDGFASAPAVVRICLARLESLYQDKFRIIRLDKTNLSQWGSSLGEIANLFENRKISIQTFADLLRLSLLEEYGGIWIDSTLFFTDDFDLESFLSQSSFNSLHTASTEGFLSYKGSRCSWTTFFLAGRKGNPVARTCKAFMMDYIHSGEPIPYFLLDYTLFYMKRHHFDNGILSGIEKRSGYEHYLVNHFFDSTTDQGIKECQRIPQKLNWREKQVSKNPKTLSGHYFVEFVF